MQPIAVNVVLRTGDSHQFSHGRSWSEAAVDGSLVIENLSGTTIAVIAPDRWDAVGYIYEPLSTPSLEPVPSPEPAPCPLRSLFRQVFLRGYRKRAAK